MVDILCRRSAGRALARGPLLTGPDGTAVASPAGPVPTVAGGFGAVDGRISGGVPVGGWLAWRYSA